jgi:adhesin transport system outer membrane protein
LASSVAKVDEIKRNVTEEIQTEWTRLNTAIGNADLIERAMTSSRAVHESYERQFEAGRKSWLDLLNTLRETQAQEIQWIQAVGAAQVAHNKLRLKSGEWIHQP